ncbi:MAG: PTS system trehalose-specific EIIBC component [Coriobacteriales bacterium]|nr:PTS system trehalose-specific EIIBC component [Coriobacteriales bacterium]
MGKFENDAREMLRLVGGKDNIAALTHCVTRMRFTLVDPSIADVPAIEALKSAKGSFTQAGQFQVIIGNEVADFYDEFVAISGITGVSKEEAKRLAAKQGNPLQRAMGAIAEVFAPLIPAIITGGLILGFRNVLGDMPYFGPDGNATLASMSVFWSGVNHFLWLIGEAVFHLGIPVGICWSVTRKMGGTEMLGIVMGLTLVSSQLLNAYAVAGATEETWAQYSWNFGFAQVHMVGYQAQVIPAILAAITFNYLERFFKKIIPTIIQMIFVPFCSILLAVMAAHFVLGPIGWTLGSAVSAVVNAGITGDFRVIFGAIFGFLYAPLVITGLHHMTNAIDLQLIADFGGTMLWPMIALSNIAQGSAVLAMIVLQKRDENAEQVNIPASLSCYLGVTEPAIFGVNLKYMFPFVCGMIGSACAGFLSCLFSCTANAIGVGGLPGILAMQPQSMLPYALCMLVAIVVPFILTFIVGKNQGIDKAAAAAGAKAEALEAEQAAHEAAVASLPDRVNASYAANTVVSPMSGVAVDITSVPDPVFASLAMGKGVAIEPANGAVYSPVDGTITMLAGTGHALGLLADDGTEILIHIGIDTVELNGAPFTPRCKANDKVKAGQLLMIADLPAIQAAGKPTTTMVIVTNSDDYSKITPNLGNCTAGQVVVNLAK